MYVYREQFKPFLNSKLSTNDLYVYSSSALMFKNRVPFTLLVCCFPIASFATFIAFLVQKFGNLFPVSPKQFPPSS